MASIQKEEQQQQQSKSIIATFGKMKTASSDVKYILDSIAAFSHNLIHEANCTNSIKYLTELQSCLYTLWAQHDASNIYDTSWCVLMYSLNIWCISQKTIQFI